jgi:hypothetical protein
MAYSNDISDAGAIKKQNISEELPPLILNFFSIIYLISFTELNPPNHVQFHSFLSHFIEVFHFKST